MDGRRTGTCMQSRIRAHVDWDVERCAWSTVHLGLAGSHGHGPLMSGIIRACTTQRLSIVSKRVESDIETIKKTGHTTQRRRVVYKQFNALHVAKINHEYQFVYHCVAILMGDNSLL